MKNLRIFFNFIWFILDRVVFIILFIVATLTSPIWFFPLLAWERFQEHASYEHSRGDKWWFQRGKR